MGVALSKNLAVIKLLAASNERVSSGKGTRKRKNYGRIHVGPVWAVLGQFPVDSLGSPVNE